MKLTHQELVDKLTAIVINAIKEQGADLMKVAAHMKKQNDKRQSKINVVKNTYKKYNGKVKAYKPNPFNVQKVEIKDSLTKLGVK
jgi:DNA-binding protein YbaB